VDLRHVEVDHVELLRTLHHVLEHQEMRRHGILTDPAEAERRRPLGAQLRTRLRVAAREQRHVVPHAHELVAQIGDDAFRAAV
jgi:hypothetical protein